MYDYKPQLDQLKEFLNEELERKYPTNEEEEEDKKEADRVVINNFFGVGSQCEQKRTYEEIADILNRYTKGADARKNLEVMKLMYSIPYIFPESSFPSKPKSYRWKVSR